MKHLIPYPIGHPFSMADGPPVYLPQGPQTALCGKVVDSGFDIEKGQTTTNKVRATCPDCIKLIKIKNRTDGK